MRALRDRTNRVTPAIPSRIPKPASSRKARATERLSDNGTEAEKTSCLSVSGLPFRVSVHAATAPPDREATEIRLPKSASSECREPSGPTLRLEAWVLSRNVLGNDVPESDDDDSRTSTMEPVRSSVRS